MTENDLLLDAVLAAPADTDRLVAYADWLEDREDPRATYTRLQIALRQAGPDAAPSVLAELRRLYPADRLAWTGRLEQAGVFRANLLDLRSMWWGVGLGARATSATYEGFPWHRQPPLPVERFDGTFGWLRDAPPVPDGGEGSTWLARLDGLRSRGFFVPVELVQLMTDSELQRQIPSCTDNFFQRADEAEEHALPDDACFLTFYSDSQSCVLWGIRLGRNERYAPILAGVPEHPDEDADAPAPGEPYFRFPDLTWSAPTLESFLYRWWIENTIWYATEWKPLRRPLNAEEQAYLDALAVSAAAPPSSTGLDSRSGDL